MYEHISVNDKILDVMAHPAFEGRGRLLFPWDSRLRYNHRMTMKDAPKLLLWHTNMDPQQMVDGVNYLIDKINEGKRILYDFYSEEDKIRDHTKKDTGLFFFRGKPGAPFAVCSAGGGMVYVGSLHGSIPHAIDLAGRGYNAFVMKYRVGHEDNAAANDLIAAVKYIREHADEFQVDPEGYSVWGGSAGARLSSEACYGEAGISRKDIIHPATAVIAYTTFMGDPNFESTDAPAYMIVGTNDWIVDYRIMTERAEVMRAAGIPVKCVVLPGVEHGFGTGVGMEAEGWMDDAVAFWEEQRVRKY